MAAIRLRAYQAPDCFCCGQGFCSPWMTYNEAGPGPLLPDGLPDPIAWEFTVPDSFLWSFLDPGTEYQIPFSGAFGKITHLVTSYTLTALGGGLFRVAGTARMELGLGDSAHFPPAWTVYDNTLNLDGSCTENPLSAFPVLPDPENQSPYPVPLSVCPPCGIGSLISEADYSARYVTKELAWFLTFIDAGGTVRMVQIALVPPTRSPPYLQVRFCVRLITMPVRT